MKDDRRHDWTSRDEMPHELAEDLRQRADERGMPVAELLRQAVALDRMLWDCPDHSVIVWNLATGERYLVAGTRKGPRRIRPYRTHNDLWDRYAAQFAPIAVAIVGAVAMVLGVVGIAYTAWAMLAGWMVLGPLTYRPCPLRPLLRGTTAATSCLAVWALMQHLI